MLQGLKRYLEYKGFLVYDAFQRCDGTIEVYMNLWPEQDFLKRLRAAYDCHILPGTIGDIFDYEKRLYQRKGLLKATLC